MSLYLVVTTPFQFYGIGDTITNSALIDAVRLSDYAGCAVMVSDVVIPPPVSQPKPTLAELQALYADLQGQYTGQQASLDAANALNTSQQSALDAQQQRILDLANAIAVLQAQISNPNGGVPLPPNLADDVPLEENDGSALVTDKGARLVGDVRA